jgi:zinc protease
MTDLAHSLPYSGNIHRVELPNGLILMAYHNPAVRSVNVMGSLLAGSAYEAPDERMVAAVMGDMLIRGSTQRDFDTIAADLEDIGAALDFSGRTFTLNYSGKALAEDFSHLLATIAELLRQPSFPADHLALVKQEMRTSLQVAMQDSRFRAGQAMREALYPVGHPLHQPLAGYAEALDAITPETLRRFHQRFISPQRMTLIVVGAVEPLDVEREVQHILGDWDAPAVAQPTPPLAPQPAQELRLHTALPGKTQTDIVMGRLGPSRLDPDYMIASLANSILGEFGMMGRLGASIREQSGLAYYATSRLDPSVVQGVWSIAAGVADHNVELAIAKAKAEVRRLTEELVSEDELADNKNYFIGNLPLRLESSAGIANMLEAMERYQLGLDYLLTYPDRMNAITREDVQRVASQYLDAEAFCISTAGSVG